MADDIVANCSTGEIEQVPLTADQVAEMQAAQQAYADQQAAAAAAEQAYQQKVANARQILANNPDLQTVLDALKLCLPASP